MAEINECEEKCENGRALELIERVLNREQGTGPFQVLLLALLEKKCSFLIKEGRMEEAEEVVQLSLEQERSGLRFH